MTGDAPSSPSEPSIKISVVIPSYRRPDALRLAVRSVLQQDLDPTQYELIVVDSSPDDENVRAVREEAASANCHVEVLTKNAEGPAASRNMGWQHAKGEYIAFMDSDCQATPGWLRGGLALFNDASVGLVQGQTIPDPSQRTGIFTWYVHVSEENFIYECANVFYSRKALEDVDGFAPEYVNPGAFVLGGEDLDLAWRVKRAGWKSSFSADALVYHEVQPMPVRRWIWIERNQLFPGLAKKFPEIRQFFYRRYFLDRHQALFVLGLVSLPFLIVSWFALLGWIPYIVSRSSEPTRSLPGILRPIRAMVYVPRDVSTFLILFWASIKARSILL